jgi:HSP20 family molecular chaperone IbpA
MKFYVNDYSNSFDNGCRTNLSNMQTKYPALNIVEKKNEYLIEVELPGFTIDDINLKLEKHVLKISSKKDKVVSDEDKNEEKAEEKRTFLLKERVKKDFERSLALGNDVDEDKLTASLKNGLLLINLPKMEQMLPRNIDVAAV